MRLLCRPDWTGRPMLDVDVESGVIAFKSSLSQQRRNSSLNELQLENNRDIGT